MTKSKSNKPRSAGLETTGLFKPSVFVSVQFVNHSNSIAHLWTERLHVVHDNLPYIVAMTITFHQVSLRIPSCTVSLARGNSCLSRVSLSVSAINRFFSQANDRIATKLAHDGPQTPGKPASRVCSRSRSRSAFSWVPSLWLAGKSCSAPPFCACWQCTQQKAGPRAYAHILYFRSSLRVCLSVCPCVCTICQKVLNRFWWEIMPTC